MPPKHSLDAPTRPPSAVKRIRTISTPTVKRGHKANFHRLCTLHNWTPSEKVRDKLADLLSLSGPRLQSSELLPLAFVQFYPFIWVQDMLLLGYNEANDSVWYKAHPAEGGIARGRYYNSAQENFRGKQTVTRYWQSWVDVFDIDKQGLDRSHEFFTGVYLILKKFPNLRYKTLKGQSRDVQSAFRETGTSEHPFNDDHKFMQDKPDNSNEIEHDEYEASLEGERNEMSKEQRENKYVKEERTGSYGNEDRSNFSPRPLSMQMDSRANSRANSRVLEKTSSLQRDASTTQTTEERPGQHENHARSSMLSRPLLMHLNSRAKSREHQTASFPKANRHSTERKSVQDGNIVASNPPHGLRTSESHLRADLRESGTNITSQSYPQAGDRRAGTYSATENLNVPSDLVLLEQILGANPHRSSNHKAVDGLGSYDTDDDGLTSLPPKARKLAPHAASSRPNMARSRYFDRADDETGGRGEERRRETESLPAQPVKRYNTRARTATSRMSKPAQVAALRKPRPRPKPSIEDDMEPSTHGTDPFVQAVSHVDNQQASDDGDLGFDRGSQTNSVQDVEVYNNLIPAPIAPATSRIIRRDNQNFREFTFQIPIEEFPRWSTSEFDYVSGPSIETVPEQSIVMTEPAAPGFAFSNYETTECVPVAPSNRETVEFASVEDEEDQIKDEDMVKDEDF
ncbi:hypothetical protein D6C86_04907 [Aureobasidium pullulans]|uniref:Uncharacterized protein n=1 Tax=Aureobasidium pullulans TaxID=5580 RepID=A0A4S9W6S1_AURPU|nr:hypothetical protein D6C94_05343 [Aureobasidium pullulans]THZ44317.1 hypothetical protein D6C87_03660 [Aureobasidium pullulans]THZ60710.1 hypothetical protein D6C86_04907 [Aureobasidium pullulans]THZ95238.1 hypothetical protein D6C88_02017 [Aureobasidium pullulans]